MATRWNFEVKTNKFHINKISTNISGYKTTNVTYRYVTKHISYLVRILWSVRCYITDNETLRTALYDNLCHVDEHKMRMLIKIQPNAAVCRYLFTAKSLYMFRVSQHPSSGVLKTVIAASGTGHNTGTATSSQRGLIGTLRNEKFLYRGHRLNILMRILRLLYRAASWQLNEDRPTWCHLLYYFII